MSNAINSITVSLPQDLSKAVDEMLVEWQKSNLAKRMWARDASIWTGSDEANWLGWLDIVQAELNDAQKFTSFAKEVQDGGFTHVLVLGMGGSSLCPEVMSHTFGRIPGFPELLVLDSTDPAQVKSSERKVNLEKSLFIVASKSGSTLEPNIFKQYFFERMKQTVSAGNAGKHFVAITDPGSKMQQVAEADRFRRIFFGVPAIGGRYSALSDFGMIPATAMGVNTAEFLKRTGAMVRACAATEDLKSNPGVSLGVILGVLSYGRNKLTVVASPGIYDLGAWLEQLIAESTGKRGKALIPVDRETPGSPEVYGPDRLFVYLRLESAPNAQQDSAVAAIERAGSPVVRIDVQDIYNLGQEFFRWEIATAVAGSIMGINPFDQPDVEASKIATRALTTEYEAKGALPAESPFFEQNGIGLFTDDRNADELKTAATGDASLRGYLQAHLQRLKPGDYFAVLAYVEMNEDNEALLQQLRHRVRDRMKIATCLGFGPRFLHSTGQAYKGGPDTGVFLQITCEDDVDLPVPGQKYTFGVVKAAQARGDFQVLTDRKRRALRVHLGKDVPSDLKKLIELMR